MTTSPTRVNFREADRIRTCGRAFALLGLQPSALSHSATASYSRGVVTRKSAYSTVCGTGFVSCSGRIPHPGSHPIHRVSRGYDPPPAQDVQHDLNTTIVIACPTAASNLIRASRPARNCTLICWVGTSYASCYTTDPNLRSPDGNRTHPQRPSGRHPFRGVRNCDQHIRLRHTMYVSDESATFKELPRQPGTYLSSR